MRTGKLPGAEALATDISGHLAGQDFSELGIAVSPAQRARALPGPLPDPFDRVLITQAQAENLPIVGPDKACDAYGVTRLW